VEFLVFHMEVWLLSFATDALYVHLGKRKAGLLSLLSLIESPTMHRMAMSREAHHCSQGTYLFLWRLATGIVPHPFSLLVGVLGDLGGKTDAPIDASNTSFALLYSLGTIEATKDPIVWAISYTTPSNQLCSPIPVRHFF